MPKEVPATPAFSVTSVNVPSRLFLYSALRTGFGGFQKSLGPLLTRKMSTQPSSFDAGCRRRHCGRRRRKSFSTFGVCAGFQEGLICVAGGLVSGAYNQG